MKPLSEEELMGVQGKPREQLDLVGLGVLSRSARS